MWSLSPATLHVSLGTHALHWATTPALRSAGVSACGTVAYKQGSTANLAAEPWRSAVDALAEFLADKGHRHPKPLRMVLAGRWVHWQLLPWREEITQPQEMAAYAGLRFRETFGAPAQGWQVLHVAQAPNAAIPGCAVDAKLVDALRTTCAGAGAKLSTVTPYFASAFDRWRGALKGNTVWFCLLESDCLSLGLLENKQWLALRSQRLDGDWRETLPGMIAQMGISAGLADAAVPLYLAGPQEPPAPVAGLPWVWLHPRLKTPLAAVGCRMALGV